MNIKIGSSDVFQKSRSHLKILGARCVTRSKTFIDDTQILVSTAHNSGAWDLCTLLKITVFWM